MMDGIEFRKPSPDDFGLWQRLRSELYPEFDKAMLDEEFGLICSDSGYHCRIAFRNNEPLGFFEVQLRNNVSGTFGSQSLYLESIYVRKQFRRQGVAKAMFAKVRKMASEMGVKSIGSDAYITNDKSIEMHKALGFTEVNRLVHFYMELE